MLCLCCGAPPELGVLCRGCAQAIAPCEGLIADHVRSTVDSGGARGWLIDGFGRAHAVGERASIGRRLDGGMVILAASVSREHAELAHADGGWTVRDLGSRNGTFVDGARCQGRVALAARCQLRFGDVALWFLAEVRQAPAAAPAMATGGAGAGLVRYQLAHGAIEVCVLGAGEGAVGGAVLVRPAGASSWTERGLAPLEYQLLRTLCARAHDEAGSPSVVRGCVPTKQLARELPFQSKYANEENVRQVVRRLRGVLGELGADGVIAAAPGRGYYLACPVRIEAAARAQIT